MSFSKVSYKDPAKKGDILFFKDPDPTIAGKWVRVASGPDIREFDDFEEWAEAEREEIYDDMIVVLEGGTEVYTRELYRGS